MNMSDDKKSIRLQLREVSGEWSRKLNPFFDLTIFPLNAIKKEVEPEASTCHASEAIDLT